jgi:uncharacterized membrane protein
MDVAVTAAVLSALFVSSHIGLATVPVRSRITARLGEWGYLWCYFAVAAATFSAATVYCADHLSEGPQGLALGRIALVRDVLVVTLTAGVMLMVASFSSYGRSPYSVGHRGSSPEPSGLERVTRHPFFAGMTLFGVAHVLLATHLVPALYMVALTILAAVGSQHQDRKLARLRGPGFERYVASTSMVPFAAILAGRQQLVVRELPWGALAAGVGVAFLFRRAHEHLFAFRGVWVIAATVGGALVITLTTWLRDRRRARRLHVPAGRAT